jgi:hypothetical protein
MTPGRKLGWYWYEGMLIVADVRSAGNAAGCTEGRRDPARIPGGC